MYKYYNNKYKIGIICFIILIIILVIFLIYRKTNKKENFEEYTSQKDAIEYRKKTNTIGDPFIMKRRAGEIIDIEKQFDNVEIYDNDYDLKNGLTGYDKCLIDETNKACVEYGLTGITTGFK